jgi:hypothetical protein
MRDFEFSHDLEVDTIPRWYVAPMMPATYDLQAHLRERRTLVEVLEKRRLVMDSLARQRAAATASREQSRQGARAPAAQELKAKAARYRELAETLLDPIVVAAVENCAQELERDIAAGEKADESSTPRISP